MSLSWKIVSKDDNTHSMIVQYGEDSDHLLNIQQPPRGTTIGSWVSAHAPRELVQSDDDFEQVWVGEEGVLEDPSPMSESANVVGNWNEEYLRAMIYQILEEMRESAV